MQRFLNLSIFAGALRVSGGSSAHHQEHITVYTASGIVNFDNICYDARTYEYIKKFLT